MKEFDLFLKERNIKLRLNQYKYIESMLLGKNTRVNLPRREGTTTISCLYLAFMAINFKQDIVIQGFRREESMRILDIIYSYIDVKTRKRYSIELENGSSIRILHYIRGSSIDILYTNDNIDYFRGQVIS